MNTVPVDWEDRIRRASRRRPLRYDPARSVDVGEIRRCAVLEWIWWRKRGRPKSLQQCWVREIRDRRYIQRCEAGWRRIVRAWGDENRRMGLYD